MTIRFYACCAAMLAFATATWAAEQPHKTKPAKASAKKIVKRAVAKPAKTSASSVAKRHAKATPKKAPRMLAKRHVPAQGNAMVKTSLKRSPVPSHAPARLLRGKTEVLTCRDGTEDRHARIALVLVGGKADAFAYYSKWKPRTCSIYLQRNRDGYSKWSDAGSITSVSVERGIFLIEHKKNEYRLVFRDVDRERYCGMDGAINGTLTIRKGVERCEIAGIMEEGVPLGQAYANLDTGTAAATASDAAPEAVQPAAPRATAGAAPTSPFRKLAQWFRRHADAPVAPPPAGVSD